MSEPSSRRDTSWFTDILLSQESDYSARAHLPRVGRAHSRPVTRAVNFLALGITGLVLAAAANLVAHSRPVVERTRVDLLARINSMQERTAELESGNARMRSRNSQLEQFVLPDIDNQLASQLAAVRAAGGYGALAGGGLVVTLTNPERGDEVSEVYDVDLQVLVNALFAAGAEGVSVDGIRITASTSIREAGGAILVDYKPISSPYVVSAVGDGLLEGLRNSVHQVWLDDLEASYGISIDYKRRESVRLPAGRVQAVEYAEEVAR